MMTTVNNETNEIKKTLAVIEQNVERLDKLMRDDYFDNVCIDMQYGKHDELPTDDQMVYMDGKTYKELVIAKNWFDNYISNLNGNTWALYQDNSYSTQGYNSNL